MVVFVLNGGDSQNNGIRSGVIEAIEQGYVAGMFREVDLDLVEKYWHKDCDLVGFKDNTVVKTNLHRRLEAARESGKLPKRVPDVRHEITSMDITGNAAVATVQIYFGDTHIFTDYFSLYKFADGWKIVTKIWYRHPEK
jgi:hypothetical protein